MLSRFSEVIRARVWGGCVRLFSVRSGSVAGLRSGHSRRPRPSPPTAHWASMPCRGSADGKSVVGPVGPCATIHTSSKSCSPLHSFIDLARHGMALSWRPKWLTVWLRRPLDEMVALDGQCQIRDSTLETHPRPPGRGSRDPAKTGIGEDPTRRECSGVLAGRDERGG